MLEILFSFQDYYFVFLYLFVALHRYSWKTGSLHKTAFIIICMFYHQNIFFQNKLADNPFFGLRCRGLCGLEVVAY